MKQNDYILEITILKFLRSLKNGVRIRFVRWQTNEYTTSARSNNWPQTGNSFIVSNKSGWKALTRKFSHQYLTFCLVLDVLFHLIFGIPKMLYFLQCQIIVCNLLLFYSHFVSIVVANTCVDEGAILMCVYKSCSRVRDFHFAVDECIWHVWIFILFYFTFFIFFLALECLVLLALRHIYGNRKHRRYVIRTHRVCACKR